MFADVQKAIIEEMLARVRKTVSLPDDFEAVVSVAACHAEQAAKADSAGQQRSGIGVTGARGDVAIAASTRCADIITEQAVDNIAREARCTHSCGVDPSSGG